VNQTLDKSSSRVQALRGATTVDLDDATHIGERTQELLAELVERNEIDHDDFVSIWFTATSDLHAAFPASAVRNAGYGDVALLCAQELDIVGATPLCIRILAHVYTTRTRDQLRHVYLHGAVGLRDDLRVD
jgi:chorismate mutase